VPTTTFTKNILTKEINHTHQYFMINKPYKMVSQFISSHEVRLLGDLDFDFPEGTHAIGRLDNHSEGLLLLTTNKKVTRLLFAPDKKHKRTYLVMVKNIVSEKTLQQLKKGVAITITKGETYIAVPESIEIVTNVKEYYLYMDDFRVSYPHTWLLMTLTEGKFHQVRKMVMAVNHRCQRLVRISIENLLLGDIKPGCAKEIKEASFFEQLGIAYNG
jgi:23S rRNA pseudouridine2457 synthase